MRKGDVTMDRRATPAWLALVFVALAVPAHAGPAPETLAPSATGVTTLRCGTLIDGRSASVKRDVAIRIENGRVVAVGAFTPGAAAR